MAALAERDLAHSDGLSAGGSQDQQQGYEQGEAACHQDNLAEQVRFHQVFTMD
jgi:hypothetical protein